MAEGVTNLNVPPPPDQPVVDAGSKAGGLAGAGGLMRLAEKWRAWFTALGEVTNWAVTNALSVGGAFTAVTGVFSGALTALSLTLTGAAPSTPAANTQYANSICKAWGTFNLAAGTILADFNIDTFVRNGVGDATVTFKTAMADTNYTWSAFGIATLAPRTLAFSEIAGTRTVNGFEFNVMKISAVPNVSLDDVTLMGITVFGN